MACLCREMGGGGPGVIMDFVSGRMRMGSNANDVVVLAALQ